MLIEAASVNAEDSMGVTECQRRSVRWHLQQQRPRSSASIVSAVFGTERRLSSIDQGSRGGGWVSCRRARLGAPVTISAV